jgi:hypothetical protein
LTSDSIVSGNVGTICFRSQEESNGGEETLPGGGETSISIDPKVETHYERGVGAETIVNEVSK